MIKLIKNLLTNCLAKGYSKGEAIEMVINVISPRYIYITSENRGKYIKIFWQIMRMIEPEDIEKEKENVRKFNNICP